ncbi:MAG: hypothetical protein LQ337_006414 [Flavoplaca oasis]|nr:MAG: hypothetical protein LQ337_006414 [Flavoplaca oasis]
MSRRAPNPAAERAAQNQQTIKTLLKLEGNKSCADCKRNKHPRWASWNLGIFICIRCSGIHRGMGTHISRVKSVDLDAWTDEQLQSVLRWGNSRANKYWESKLAEGHVPSEAKIENFIRTKYESKRWVLEGPMPDPSTLDAEGDDDVPLNVVQEKAKMERSSSQRISSTSSQPTQTAPKPAPQIDLFGDVPAPPARPSTTDTPSVRPPPPKAAAAPANQQKQGDSLLGLDFFGGPPSTSTARPSSATSTPRGPMPPSRPDLKQSILSLYSSAPRTQPQFQQESQDIFGGMQSPTSQQQSTSGGLDDAFSSLSFASTTSPQAQPVNKADPFASFSKPSTQSSSFTSPPVKSPPPLSGGGFFDPGTKSTMKPANASKHPVQPTRPLQTPGASNGLGDFSFASNTIAPDTKQPSNAASSNLFDFSNPLTSQAPISSKPPPSNLNSAFNLSAPAPFSQPAAKSAPVAPVSSSAFSGFSNDDPWGSNDAWATPEPAPASKPKMETGSPTITTTNDFSSWGAPPITTNSRFGANSSFKETPKIAADEDFGGWNSAAPETPAASKPSTQATTKPSGGFGGSEDLFSNVWE